jgi:hypothetical protein
MLEPQLKLITRGIPASLQAAHSAEALGTKVIIVVEATATGLDLDDCDLIFTRHFALASAMLQSSDEQCAQTPDRVVGQLPAYPRRQVCYRKISKLSVCGHPGRCMHLFASLASSGENRQTPRRRCRRCRTAPGRLR